MQTVLNTVTGLLSVGSGLAFVAITKMAIDVATHKNNNWQLTEVIAMLIAVMVSDRDQFFQSVDTCRIGCARAESHAAYHVPSLIEQKLDEHSSLSQRRCAQSFV